ncbi:MAG: Smr/MutS family protein, partial [Bacteroidota bacterium]
KKESPKTIASKESLKHYTNKAAAEKSQSNRWFNLQEMPHEVWEMATFKNEIDLHIQNLLDDPTSIDKKQILGVQLSHFEDFMQQAIRIGVDRVFIIHGVGEGKLRAEVQKRLSDIPEVKSFKNEYHGRYGYGATEVIF